MTNYDLPLYDDPKSWIENQYKHARSWEDILHLLASDKSEIKMRLRSRVESDFWPEMDYDEWEGLVLYMKDKTENANQSAAAESATLHDENEDNELEIPKSRNSAWQLYKKKLSKKNFKQSSIDEIEKSCFKILKRLSADTTNIPAVKGLVIGNVQSGKTANMSGLMAMAADWGWNMFIVLSGTIENLRKQTQKRIFKDLNNKSGMLTWHSIEHLGKNMPVGQNAADYHFQEGSNNRYMTVCLKNVTRLKKMLQWLQADPKTQQQMKVLLIEDESDQASINTLDVDKERRTAINRLLCNLANGKDENDRDSIGQFKAMNYIGYTATPYANVLNDDSKQSLYPRSFITCLQASNEYFGPQQIYGLEGGDYDGLNIIRTISIGDVNTIKKGIHEGTGEEIPESLKDALCWFMCSVAYMRFTGYGKPVSMLIHTSQLTSDHAYVADAIDRWIDGEGKTSLMNRCKKVYAKESASLSKKAFREQYPDYGREDSEIIDYPSYEEIEPLLDTLLSRKMSHIKMDKDENPIYHEGIHLCIDDCKNNGIDENDEHVRLFYPDEDNMPEPEPAFIVIGGATLSRGLTIEGLVSTYFLRTVKQADTLMQMGRWFGYRTGYELIPRIWLTKATTEKFEYLSMMDQALRDEIREMEILGKSPAQYGPKIKNSPARFRITAKNRMQHAEAAVLDYTGTYLQTFLFDNDAKILESNLNATKSFIGSLGKADDPSTYNKSCVVWRSVHFKAIKEYINKYKFQQRMRTLNDIAPLMQWIDAITKKGMLNDWNVVLAGLNESKKPRFELTNGVSITKVERTVKTNRGDDGILDIGVLRNPKDLLADINLKEASDEIKNLIITEGDKSPKSVRTKAGYGKIPQLLVYIIDKDSKARPGSETRADLNAPVDIAGICINIPGETTARGNTASVSIRITPDNDELFNYND